MMFTPVLLLKKKIGIQFNLLPKKRYEEKDKIYYLGKDNCITGWKRQMCTSIDLLILGTKCTLFRVLRNCILTD